MIVPFFPLGQVDHVAIFLMRQEALPEVNIACVLSDVSVYGGSDIRCLTLFPVNVLD